MKRFSFALAGLLLALSVGQAQAAVEDLIDGVINRLEDDDFESIIVGDGDGTIDAGDLIAGVFKVQQIIDEPAQSTSVNLQGADDTFTGFFLLETIVGDDGAPNTNEVLEFGAPSQADWDAVFGDGGIIDLGLGPGGLTPDPDTVVFVYEGVNFNDATNSGTLQDAAQSFINGGTLLWEFGLDGAGTFWTTSGEDPGVIALALTNSLTNRLSLNVTQEHAGSGIALDPHNFFGTIGGDLNFTTPTQLQGKGGFVSTGSPFDLVTDTDFVINPRIVPEPSTVAIWSLLGLVFAGGAWRRRNR